MSDAGGHGGNTPPPSYPPPETVDAVAGAVRLPFETHALSSHSRALRGCCWNADSMSMFAPERESRTARRSHVNVSMLLRERGMDQPTFDVFITDVKETLASSVDYVSGLCAVAGIFSVVLAPFCCVYSCVSLCKSSAREEKFLSALERVIERTNAEWEPRFGIRVTLERDVAYKRPRVPSEDALPGFKKMPLESSEWTGSMLVFTGFR